MTVAFAVNTEKSKWLIALQLSCLEKLLDLWLAAIWISVSHEVLDNFSFTVKEELLEVPGHVSTFKLRVFSKPSEEWVLSLVHDSDLLGDREFNTVFLEAFLPDPLGIVRFLRTKLVARESNDLKTLVFMILVHLD